MTATVNGKTVPVSESNYVYTIDVDERGMVKRTVTKKLQYRLSDTL